MKPQINIMAAMMDNRGIGRNGELPWPSLPSEFKYYTHFVTTPKQKGRKCVHIKGRKTFEDGRRREGILPNSFTIVVSRSLNSCPEGADHLAKSYEEAIDFTSSPSMEAITDTVWVMGGAEIYQAAVHSPHTDMIYLTRIALSLESDTFFPLFEKQYEKIEDRLVPNEVQEENGIKFEFGLYKRKECVS